MRGDAGGVMQRAAGGFMLAIGKPHSKGAGHSEFTMMAAWGQPAPRALRSNGSAKPRVAAAASASSGGTDAPEATIPRVASFEKAFQGSGRGQLVSQCLNDIARNFADSPYQRIS